MIRVPAVLILFIEVIKVCFPGDSLPIPVGSDRRTYHRSKAAELVPPGCKFLLHKDNADGNGSRWAD